jgi:L-alanine-DL-glutamate epimerase-like enolase superfamily enzyme
LGRLRAETGIRILLDESAAPPFPEPGPEYAQACDAVNLRISRCGGFLAALRECEWIRARGLGFQLGIHVGEMGPSWAAGRHFIAGVEGAIAYEAGQADRWFPTRIFSPAPGVDRTTYLGWPLPGPGLGLRPTPALGACVRDAYRWDENAGRWSPVSGWTAPEEWEAEAEHA